MEAAGSVVGHLLDGVTGANDNRTQRRGMPVVDPPKRHRHREEPRRAEGFDIGPELLEMTAERFAALVHAEHRLEPGTHRRRPARRERVELEGIE